jgi:twinfilin-like protein
MAFANLQVSDDLKNAFIEAQRDLSTRYFVVKIKNEVISLSSEQPKSGSDADDFATIVDSVSEHEPSFVLYRRDIAKNSNERPWTLVSYVPDTSKVRQKMLYASSKKDLLRTLGNSFFGDSSFYVSDAADLTFEGMVHATRKATDEERQQMLTKEEQFAYEAAAGEGVDDDDEDLDSAPVLPSNSKNSGAVPFQFDDSTTTALKSFAAGERHAIEIKIDLKKEICKLGALDGATAKENLEAAIVQDAPRFYLLNYEGVKVFVYCCPEMSKIRSRMLYSTCRSTVLGVANEHGIKFDKTAEMRDASEIADCLSTESAPASAATAVVKDVTKVQRRTRGKRRLRKKHDWSK